MRNHRESIEKFDTIPYCKGMNKNKPTSTILANIEMLTKPSVLFYLMPALMILLIAGTLAQADIGLYESHHRYFAAFVIWFGYLPLPGGYTLLGILTTSLLFKFLFFSEWSKKKSGIILTHLGALVLLIGGLLTGVFAREGYMVIPEGAQSSYVYDYHIRELVIVQDETNIQRIAFSELLAGESLTKAIIPFQIDVLSLCENCGIIKREEAVETFNPDTLKSMAQFMALIPKAKAKVAEENLSGLTLRLSGLDEAQNGIYLAFDAMPKPISLSHNGHTYDIVFGKQQRSLPFALRLDDFVKTSYPGTMMAKAYHSDVKVLDDSLQWGARIEMNAPLRYRGYTFYQSSFEQTADDETTILSVVENHGRIFPYIGTLIIMVGLGIHTMIVMRARRKA